MIMHFGILSLTRTTLRRENQGGSFDGDFPKWNVTPMASLVVLRFDPGILSAGFSLFVFDEKIIAFNLLFLVPSNHYCEDFAQKNTPTFLPI